MKRLIIIAAIFLLWLMSQGQALGQSDAEQEGLPTDEQHKGVIAIGKYEIFPQNRPNNGVYLDKQFLLSIPDHTIVDLYPLNEDQSFAWLAVDDDNKAQFDLNLPFAQYAPRIKRYGLYYHAIFLIKSIAYKSLFYVQDNTKIINSYPQSRTVDGITLGKIGMLFYHIGFVDNETEPVTYGVYIHFLNYSNQQVTTLEPAIVSIKPSLKLEWKTEQTFEYTAEDQSPVVVDLSQLTP